MTSARPQIGAWKDWLATVALGLVVFALASANLLFTREVGRIASVWAPNAVALAVLLRARSENWRRLLLAGYVGNIAANFAVIDTAPVGLMLAGCNSAEILLCATLIRRFIPDAVDLARKADLMVFLVIGGLVGPTVAALGAATTLTVFREQAFLPNLLSWWAPDALGLLTVTPALLALTGESIAGLAAKLKSGRSGLSVVVLALCLAIVFGQTQFPLLFVIPSALILVAFELNLAGAALALLITALTAVVATLTDHGPIALVRSGMAVRLAVTQVFMVTMTLSVLPVASTLSRRARMQLELREANRFSGLAEELAGVGYWRRDLITGRSLWSAETFRLFGLPPDFDLGSNAEIKLFAPEDQALIRSTLQRVRVSGEPYELKVRLRRADDGRERIVVLKGEVEPFTGAQADAIFGVMQDVTDEEIALRRLEESEARFRQLADSSTDVVVKLNPQNVIEYISVSARRYGYEPEDLVGRSGRDLIHPEDQPRMESMMRDLFVRGEVEAGADRVYRMRTASGGYVWMEGNPSVIRDDAGATVAVVSQLRDVSDRIAATAALADSELRYRIIAENATDVVSRATPDGRFTYLSPSIRTVLGYAPEELVGTNPVSKIHPEDRPGFIAFWRQVGDQAGPERPTLQFRGRHKDGRWIWLEANPTAVRRKDGAVVEIVDVIRNVSARVRLEADLLAARDAAIAAAMAKTEFLANMSHEIRTPLTGVIGFSQLLQDEPLSGKAQRYVQRIQTAGETLLAVVNDILDFSKLEAAQIVLDPHGFDPRAYLAETLELVGGQATAKGLSLTVSCDETVPALVFADSARVRQVLLNLLTNAIKFTSEGGVEVRAAHDGAQLKISVADTGPGVPEALRHRLFQRFSQVDGSISREHGGTGLGLAICKNLVELMGGEIAADSRPGGGSLFWFTVAAPPAEQAEVAEADVEAELEAAPARILIVDDTEANRDLVRTMLEALGHSCREAAGGAEAVSVAMRERFDLILMDMQMPGMDGVAATRAIRETSDLNRTSPIVALSANVLPDQIAACRQAGMDDHIGKPIAPRDLILKVSHWIDLSRSGGRGEGAAQSGAAG